MGKWAALAIAALCVLAAALAIAWSVRRNAQHQAKLAAMDAEKQQLRSRHEALERQLSQLQQAIAPGPGQDTGRILEALRQKDQEAESSRASEAAVRGELRTRLDQIQRTVADRDVRIAELEASLAKLEEDYRRVSEAQAELTEKVNSANRVIDAMDTELRAKNARMTRLEITNRELQQARSQLEKDKAQARQLLQQLEETERRRDVYLTSILRRYKDITDQYRALASRWDRAPTETAAAPGNEISRIQDAISLTEEDLRQLNSINSRVQALRGKLAGQ